MKGVRLIAVLCSLALAQSAVRAEKVTVAAAADLKFAMDELVSTFKQANPAAQVDVVYGSSGNFYAQIKQGAPYDLFFSADITYPKQLVSSGLAATDVKSYAF